MPVYGQISIDVKMTPDGEEMLYFRPDPTPLLDEYNSESVKSSRHVSFVTSSRQLLYSETFASFR